MTSRFVPAIAEDDYESFRNILGHNIPDDYREWLNLAFEMSTDNISQGYDTAPIEVTPDEFVQYCEATKDPCDLHSLERFANSKGVGDYNTASDPDEQPPRPQRGFRIAANFAKLPELLRHRSG